MKASLLYFSLYVCTVPIVLFVCPSTLVFVFLFFEIDWISCVWTCSTAVVVVLLVDSLKNLLNEIISIYLEVDLWFLSFLFFSLIFLIWNIVWTNLCVFFLSVHLSNIVFFFFLNIKVLAEWWYIYIKPVFLSSSFFLLMFYFEILNGT